MTADELETDQIGYISALPSDNELAVQLLEQGFSIGTEIEMAHKAPFSGSIAFKLHNTKLFISSSVAKQIRVVE
tara:strand:- start:278 stop:499 length:222 start_codon:yes stop_codon:yes gene_type:complete